MLLRVCQQHQVFASDCIPVQAVANTITSKCIPVQASANNPVADLIQANLVLTVLLQYNCSIICITWQHCPAAFSNGGVMASGFMFS